MDGCYYQPTQYNGWLKGAKLDGSTERDILKIAHWGTDGLYVGKGSCNGIDACSYLGPGGSNSINYHMIKIPDNSCNGDQIDQLVVIIVFLTVAPLEVMYFVAPSEVV